MGGIVYIESCCASREEAVNAVCQLYMAVLDDWIRPFAPSMTYFSALTTSSGHVFKPNSEAK
jgi:phosphoglucomutase